MRGQIFCDVEFYILDESCLGQVRIFIRKLHKTYYKTYCFSPKTKLLLGCP